MKLSARLNHLFENIIFQHQQTHYDEFWDLCCDHGFLGMKLFEKAKTSRVHLLDQVPKILDGLENKYAKFNDGRIEFRMQDAKTVELDATKNHMIVIAGVGGETLIEILEAIITNNPAAKMDFALSPNSHIFQIRQFLQPNFTLLSEDLINDANRLHEHILVRFTPNCAQSISLTGDLFWQTSPFAKKYHTKLVKHYSLINKNYPSLASQNAVEAYLFLAL
ncbi:MAG: tRNA (adenine(22)-N(1))-methyltransferase TrmK [Saccharospirillaceae bacterium]|nr:tRNA (adenine(22)-N(1))-methyltransferase TrmK [Pseudomonadales bacterium]NRB80277.1 tRNA (adenine(22)-N(1))-methyltransferase TrmK [Saccharospirillaceae bacterium]